MIREHSNEADTMHSPRFVACTHTVNGNKTPFYGHFWFVQSIDNLLVLCRNGFMKNYYSQLFICQMLKNALWLPRDKASLSTIPAGECLPCFLRWCGEAGWKKN